MTRRSLLSLVLAAGLLGTLAVTGAPAQTAKRGGILNAMLIENPPGFSIHEAATIAGVWPVASCYSNLVIYDPLKRSSPSWPRSGRGRTTTATSSSFSGRTSSGTTASRSRRGT
jgi:hypothetical protein